MIEERAMHISTSKNSWGILLIGEKEIRMFFLFYYLLILTEKILLIIIIRPIWDKAKATRVGLQTGSRFKVNFSLETESKLDDA